MKIESNETLTGIKGVFTKLAMAIALAGTLFFAAPKQAGAQGFSVQFGVGRPYPRAYYGPVYAPPVYGPGFYEERRREEWLRHQRWERERAWRDGFHGRPPAYGYDRR